MVTSGVSAEVLWSIGVADNRYGEFAGAGRYTEYSYRFPRDVVFQLGQSRPERDWSFIHPGPADFWAGSRQHSFRIEFNLSAAPSGACRFTLDFVNTHPVDPPLLEIDINAKAHYCFQLPRGTDERALANPSIGQEFVLPLFFPAHYLQPGRNYITLTTVAGSWLLYDALWLEGGLIMPQGPEIASVSVESTMFFKRVSGKLRQAIRVILDNVGLEGSGIVRLSGARKLRQTVHLLPGSNTFYLFVSPFKGSERVRLSVQVGSQERHTEFEGHKERRWKVFITPSTHTDIGYTDFQERVFVRHNENTTAALEACARNPLFKWNLEVAFQAFLFRRHSQRPFERLMERVREGRIGLQGLYLNMLTGLCSGEELVQALTRAQALGQEHRFRVESAILTDVPTSVGTMPMLLSQAGIRYFAEGVNQHRAPVFRYAPRQLQQSPFWWEGLDGSRILAIFTQGYAQASELGLTRSVEETIRRLPLWLRGFDREDYPYDAVFVYGAFGDNEPLDPRYAEVVWEWNKQWDYPQILLTRVDEFFRYVERKFAKVLPVFRGDMGVYWEDGAASSAYETSLVRWAKTDLEAAQRRYALMSFHNPSYVFPVDTIQDAWDEVLFYDEHTWGAWCSISEPYHEQTRHQWAIKAAFAERAAKKAGMLARSVTQANGLRYSGSRQAVVVWNDLSWSRDILVSVRLPKDQSSVRVRDAVTQRLLPVQKQDGRLFFIAEQVPPLGYRSYLLEAPASNDRDIGKDSALQAGLLLKQGGGEWMWETPDFQLRFDPKTGAVISLRDRWSRREWVDVQSGYGLNQFLYVLGGEGTRLVREHLAEPRFQVYTHTQTQVQLVENGPVLAVLCLRRRGEKTPPVDTWVIVQPDRRLTFLNVLHKEPTTAKEAGYFAFPFKLQYPEKGQAFVELPYGVLQVEKEQLPGGCREWFATHSFAAVSDGSVTAYLAMPHTPLLTVNDFFKGRWRSKLDHINGWLFAYVLNNYWDTNYKAEQGGDLVFAFSVSFDLGRFDPLRATKFGWERLVTMPDPRKGGDEAVWRDGEQEGWLTKSPELPMASLLRIEPETVVVGGIIRDGARLFVRLYNPTFQRIQVRCTLPGLHIQQAWQTDLLGKPQKRLSLRQGAVEVAISARSFVTVALSQSEGERP